jgi:hypothetical protein
MDSSSSPTACDALLLLLFLLLLQGSGLWAASPASPACMSLHMGSLTLTLLLQ